MPPSTPKRSILRPRSKLAHAPKSHFATKISWVIKLGPKQRSAWLRSDFGWAASGGACVERRASIGNDAALYRHRPGYGQLLGFRKRKGNRSKRAFRGGYLDQRRQSESCRAGSV